METELLSSLQLKFETYKSLFDSSPDANYVLDLNGSFIYMNDSSIKMSGYKMKELLNFSFEHLILDSELEKVYRCFESIKSGNLEQFETIFKRKNGEKKEVSITAAPIVIDEQIQGIIGTAKDITEKNKIQKKLKISQNQLQNISDSINVCLWSWDFSEGENLFISPACQKIYGYAQHDFYMDPYLWKKVVHPEDSEAVMSRQNFTEHRNPIKHEYRIIHSQGDIRWVSDYTVPIFDQSGELIRLDGVISDITQERQWEKKLQYLAYHDPLTGLPNRRFFLKKVNEAIEYAKNNNKKAAVLYLDINKFKDINDSLGHGLGDKLLKMVASRLMECIFPGEIVSRIGGDEFAFVLAGINDFEDVFPLIHRIYDAFLKPFSLRINDFVLNCSIGASFYPDHGRSPITLMKYADQAMYVAKKEGKAELQIYHPDINNKLYRRIFLGQNLYKALEHNEFSLYYQPILNMKEKGIEGMEALVRWNHPKQGMISPSEFIPLAEETGFIIPLGDWILKKACYDNKKLQEKGHIPIYTAVNVSGRQLQQKDFVSKVKQIVNDSKLDPEYLKIEITESMAMVDIQGMFEVFNELRELGIRISIDDFGTGYSALSHLKRLPVHTLKIDQSFIGDINNSSCQEAIIEAIVAMAKSLRINVVAEGVEKQEQAKFLEDIGCNAVQGYFYSKPVPLELLEDLLK